MYKRREHTALKAIDTPTMRDSRQKTCANKDQNEPSTEMTDGAVLQHHQTPHEASREDSSAGNALER